MRVLRCLRPIVAAGLVGLTLPACGGTTHHGASSRGHNDRAGAASSTPLPAGDSQSGSAQAVATPGGPTAAGSAEPTTRTGRAGGATTAGNPSASGGIAMGQGVTAAEIRVGIEIEKPIDFSAFGGKGSSTSQQSSVQAVIDYLNAHGGIASRKVVPYYHQLDVTTGTWATEDQAACTDLAEDHRVFAVISIATAPPALNCYAAHQTAFFDQRRWLITAADLQHFDDVYLVGQAVSGERWVRALAEGLATKGFLTPRSKVGVIRYDSPAFAVMMNKVLRPALMSRGIGVAQDVAVTAPGGASDLGAVAAQTNNAILKFRAAGVDHVLFLDTGGAVPFFFMPAAESQHYRPLYGMTSMEALTTVGGMVPAAQLHGSLSIGWFPPGDVADAQDPGTNAAGARCVTILKQAGTTGARGALGYCDALFLLKAALETAPSLTPSGLRQAVGALGTNYLPASTFSASFSPGQREEAASYRLVTFDDSCSCFRYAGAPSAFP